MKFLNRIGVCFGLIWCIWLRSLELDLSILLLFYYFWVPGEGFGLGILFREEKLGSWNYLGGIEGSIGIRWCSMFDLVSSWCSAGMGGLHCMVDFMGSWMGISLGTRHSWWFIVFQASGFLEFCDNTFSFIFFVSMVNYSDSCTVCCRTCMRKEENDVK